MKKSKLITTNSYFNVFPILMEELNGKVNLLEGNNLIFCEEKISLMVERYICSTFGGTFNTAVCSFGNYLRDRSSNKRVLTKEGSAMVVKRLLSNLDLSFFPARKTNLAPSLYDLIMQLKSAGITPSEIAEASLGADGILKNKLLDMHKVFSAYQNYVEENSFDDQSSLQDYIPPIINDDPTMCNTDVFLVGYVGWTRQTREIIKALLNSARSVTVILTEGDNEQVFVNETSDDYQKICKTLGIKVEKRYIPSEYTLEGKAIVDKLFEPKTMQGQQQNTDRVYLYRAENIASECEHIAQIIKGAILEGKGRYSNFTVAIPDVEYKSSLEDAFKKLSVPFFFDEKKNANNSPLICLITDYLDVLRKNMERTSLCAFFKNPLVCQDKNLSDRFENYLLKYNVNYNYVKNPFTFTYDGNDTVDAKEELIKLNEFREYICSLIEIGDIAKLLNELKVKEKLSEFSKLLADGGQAEESAINEQIYDAVLGIMEEIDLILGDQGISRIEYKNLFLSGVNALELSIIPQFNDAVFVGGYRECALVKADYLFMVGLTEGVPSYKDDVALLTDSDINKLLSLKVLVEPKIKVVNKRIRENFTMSMGAFNKRLFLSYPITNVMGDLLKPSQAIEYISCAFKVNNERFKQEYLTKGQGYTTFAREINKFAQGENIDFNSAVSFYNVNKDDDTVNSILQNANQEVAVRLTSEKGLNVNTMSASHIEDFYNCPYKCFANKFLKINERDSGQTKLNSLGTFMHSLFENYILRLDEVSDRQSSDKVFEEEKDKLVQNKTFAPFFAQAESKFSAEYAVKEAREYCYKMFEDFSASNFRPITSDNGTEVSFGDGKTYPAISLLGGGAKVKGKIDRVDVWKDYYRVLDYKTGSVSNDASKLFLGQKIQLYLYAWAINDKKWAGSYYLPIDDSYVKEGSKTKKQPTAVGVTLGEEEVVIAQDNRFIGKGKSEYLAVEKAKDGSLKNTMTADQLNCFKEYARAISERGVALMKEGFIAPAPFDNGNNKNTCSYCPYGALCGEQRFLRKCGAISKNDVIEAMGGNAKEVGEEGE